MVTLAKSPAVKTERLFEEVVGSKAFIDKAAGVITGVRVLGKISRNNDGKREYSDAAMLESATLYEGMKVNIDHPDRKTPRKERSFADGIGELRNVHVIGEGVYADLHYLKSHPLAPALVESAERFPNQFGLSHNADGVTTRRDGKVIVESVKRVHSVDIVSNPATNSGLFEQAETLEAPAVKTVTLREHIRSIPKKHKSRAALLKLLEMDGVDSGMGEMPMPPMDQAPPEETPPPPEETPVDADAQAAAAFKALVIAAVEDDTMDIGAKIARIKEILVAEEKLMGGDESAATETPPPPADDEIPEEPPADEEDDSMESKQAARLAMAEELLEAADIKPVPAQIKALASLTESADRKALIETWKSQAAAGAAATGARQKAPKPAATIPLSESVGSYPSDLMSFLGVKKRA